MSNHYKFLNLKKSTKVIKSLPYFMVADDAFSMSDNLLKPYSHTGCNFTKDEGLGQR